MSEELFGQMRQSVIDGDAAAAAALAEQALANGIPPVDAIDRGFVPGLTLVGEQFGAGDLFLPDMMLAARAMQKAVAVLEPEMKRQATERQLEELQSELARLSRLTAMGEMASTLAHEINQPLSAIANYLQGCSRLTEGIEHPNAQKIHDALAETTHQTLRAGQIIRRLREFVARGETEKRPENINKLVEEASALALVDAKEQGVKTIFRFDAGTGPVLVEKVQIQQVLVNLIRNAIEAMNGCPRKELVVETALLDHGIVEVRVADTGSGLAEEIVSRLFQPFVTTKPAGMGVGLSISKRIVEAHGGEMWAEPNPGGGTLFRFTLERSRDVRGRDAG